MGIDFNFAGYPEDNSNVGLTKDSIRALAKSSNGYLTWLFRRMVGSAKNNSVHIGRFEFLQEDFLLIKEGINTANILQNMQQLPEEAWCQSDRERTYQVHERTQSLLLIHDSDFRHVNPTYQPLYHQFKAALKPIIDSISAYYPHDGYVIRVLLARLPPGAQIDVHSDNLFSLLNCHRIHIPIETNPAVVFCVGGERKNLMAGEMWEINNATVHWVRNEGDRHRVHLIVDWVPIP